MNCPKCKGKLTVCDTVDVEGTNEIYRKRKCLECGHIFFTVEFEVDYTEDFEEIWSKNHRKTKAYWAKKAAQSK